MGNTFSSADLPLSLLPKDVLIQILARLPVFSLLRFKSVCKSWRALIESSFFIDFHTITTFNSSSSKPGTFILQTFESPICEWKRTMFMLSSRSRSGSKSGGVGGGTGGDDGDDDQVVFKMDNLGFPSCYKVFPLGIASLMMVGSCNGLICLHDSELRDVSLWNPATRQFRILPKSISLLEEEGIGGEFSNDDDFHDFIAFGFDVKTKDYKVVQITCFLPSNGPHWRMRGEEFICRVQVYSLSSNSWRLLEGITSLPAKPERQNAKQGLYLNGSYFFVGRTIHSMQMQFPDQICNNKLMLSFDFTKEIFITMQFPDQNQNLSCLVFGYLGDKMAVFTLRKSSSTGDESLCDCDDYDIWVWNEHGSDVNKESWTKLHSFRIKINGFTHPKGIYNNGEFALIETVTYGGELTKLQLFNLVTKESKKDFPIIHRVFGADTYKPSLVSIIGENGAAAAANSFLFTDLTLIEEPNFNYTQQQTLQDDANPKGLFHGNSIYCGLDSEVRKLVEKSCVGATEIITTQIDILHKLAQLLIEKETVDGEEFMSLFIDSKAELYVS